MYRTGDPRFRRRLDEIGQSLESAGVQTKSQLYDFQQLYLLPCLSSIADCFTTCIDASCPTLNLTANQRERHRRQREQGRRRGRAELNFDFYDDWDSDLENDALMGWGNEEFDRLLAGDQGYGTITHAQPQRRGRGMSYPKGRRKSAVEAGLQEDPTVIPGSSLFGKLFGGKAGKLRYKPSAADLQENPNARASTTTEGEALLREGGEGRRGGKHRRMRSQTATSGHTTDSLSSRGDIFPSDEELDDAIPLDDEFAMVLERRTTQSGPETESSSGRTRRTNEGGKRPSAGSRRSTAHSQRSSRGRESRSSTFSSTAHTPADDAAPRGYEEQPLISPINELKLEERELAEQEEAEVERKRQEARRLAEERGLAVVEDDGTGSSKEATPPQVHTPLLEPVERQDEVSAMTTPLAASDGEDEGLERDDPRAVEKDEGDGDDDDNDKKKS